MSGFSSWGGEGGSGGGCGAGVGSDSGSLVGPEGLRLLGAARQGLGGCAWGGGRGDQTCVHFVFYQSGAFKVRAGNLGASDEKQSAAALALLRGSRHTFEGLWTSVLLDWTVLGWLQVTQTQRKGPRPGRGCPQLQRLHIGQAAWPQTLSVLVFGRLCSRELTHSGVCAGERVTRARACCLLRRSPELPRDTFTPVDITVVT